MRFNDGTPLAGSITSTASSVGWSASARAHSPAFFAPDTYWNVSISMATRRGATWLRKAAGSTSHT